MFDSFKTVDIFWRRQAQVDLISKTRTEGFQSMGQGLVNFDNSNSYIHIDLKRGTVAIHDELILVVMLIEIAVRKSPSVQTVSKFEESKRSKELNVAQYVNRNSFAINFPSIKFVIQ